MSIGGAIAQGLLRGTQAAGMGRLEELRTKAKEAREDSIAKAARDYQTGERLATQTYDTEAAATKVTTDAKAAELLEGGALTRQGLQIGSAEKISAATQAGANARTRFSEGAANARQESANKHAEGLLKLRSQLDRANVPIGEINNVPVYADETSKQNDPNFKSLSDSAISAKIKEKEKIDEVEATATKKKWDATVADPAFAKLPESLQMLTAVQYSISGDVDLSKLLSGQAAGDKGAARKAPTAEQLQLAMDQISKAPEIADLHPVAVLALGAKVATQIANDEAISYDGKVLNPNDYASVARELDKGKREWSDVRQLDSASIKGVAEEWEKLHPSTPLTLPKFTAPQVKRGVLTGPTEGELELTESFGARSPQGSDIGTKIKKGISNWQADRDKRLKAAANRNK